MVGGLALMSHGLGSADVLLIALLGGVLQLEAALVITLIACISAGGHWFITRLETLPMISHIAIGYGCFSLAANCLGIFWSWSFVYKSKRMPWLAQILVCERLVIVPARVHIKKRRKYLFQDTYAASFVARCFSLTTNKAITVCQCRFAGCLFPSSVFRCLKSNKHCRKPYRHS